MHDAAKSLKREVSEELRREPRSRSEREVRTREACAHCLCRPSSHALIRSMEADRDASTAQFVAHDPQMPLG